MQKSWWVAAVCCLSLVSACAQTAKDAEDAFRASVIKQQLVLRNFSADTAVHLTWMDASLRLQLPNWHMLGVLTIKSVHLNGQQLQISGTRQMLVRDKKDQLGPSGDGQPVEVDIDLNGRDPAIVLPQIREKLFFASIDEAVAAIPRIFRENIPGSLKKVEKKPPLPECDCAAHGTDPCLDHQASGGWVNPRLLQSADPHYSPAARNKKLNGTVTLAVALDASGRITDLWVTKPLGLGLEDEAARAVRQYVFAPATCHDQPAPTSLYVDVNFQIY